MSDVEDNGEIELLNDQDENVVNDLVDNNGESGNNDATRIRYPPRHLRDYVIGLENIDNQTDHLQNLEIALAPMKIQVPMKKN